MKLNEYELVELLELDADFRYIGKDHRGSTLAFTEEPSFSFIKGWHTIKGKVITLDENYYDLDKYSAYDVSFLIKETLNGTFKETDPVFNNLSYSFDEETDDLYVIASDDWDDEENNNHDNVHQPNHYMQGGIETLEIMETLLSPEELAGFYKGNIVKYRERAPYKGKADEDYAKAKVYYDLLQNLYQDHPYLKGGKQ